MNYHECKRIFHFYNKYRNGDNIMNLRFFKSHKELLKQHNIYIHYYYNAHNTSANELEKYIDSEIITLKTIDLLPPTNTIEIWMGNNIGLVTHAEFEKYFELFYNNIYTHLQLDNSVNALWLDEPYLLTRYNELDIKFKDLDILILNNIATINNFNPYNELNKIAIELSKKYKVATVCKVSDDIPSTLDCGLSLFDIGAMGTNAKEIIAIISGPVTTLFNTITKANVSKWFLIHTFGCPFDFYSINNTLINTNNLEPIYTYYNLEKH
jgi:hypothetical protein